LNKNVLTFQAKPADTLRVCKFLNDHLAKVVGENPRRFVALGTLPMNAPTLAVEVLAICAA
jgi:aminocarboxymuconate-semialdehyde decarboxylase